MNEEKLSKMIERTSYISYKYKFGTALIFYNRDKYLKHFFETFIEICNPKNTKTYLFFEKQTNSSVCHGHCWSMEKIGLIHIRFKKLKNKEDFYGLFCILWNEFHHLNEKTMKTFPDKKMFSKFIKKFKEVSFNDK